MPAMRPQRRSPPHNNHQQEGEAAEGDNAPLTKGQFSSGKPKDHRAAVATNARSPCGTASHTSSVYVGVGRLRGGDGQLVSQ